MIERGLAKRPITREERDLNGLLKEYEDLRNEQQDLTDQIRPTTFTGRLTRTIARNRFAGSILPTGIRERIEGKTMEVVQEELRQAYLNLRSSLDDSLESSLAQLNKARDVQEKYDIIMAQEEDERIIEKTLAELDNLLNAEARAELGRRGNGKQMDALIEELKNSDPNRKAKEKAALLSQAERFLQKVKPMIAQVKVTTLTGVEVLEQTFQDYVDIRNEREALDDLSRASRNIIRASELGITSFNTSTGSMSVSLEMVKLAAKAAQVVKDYKDNVADEVYSDIEAQAKELLDTFNKNNTYQILEPKALPEKKY
jgi:hypothetical protein